jgi:hypothetical protein
MGVLLHLLIYPPRTPAIERSTRFYGNRSAPMPDEQNKTESRTLTSILISSLEVVLEQRIATRRERLAELLGKRPKAREDGPERCEDVGGGVQAGGVPGCTPPVGRAPAAASPGGSARGAGAHEGQAAPLLEVLKKVNEQVAELE